MADRLYTLAEVAKRLGGISVRTVQRRIVDAGIRPPRPGRAMVLTEGDLAALIEALRCRSPSSPQGDAKETRITSSEARSTAEALRSLQRRRTQRLLADLPGRSKKSSLKVVSLDLERR